MLSRMQDLAIISVKLVLIPGYLLDDEVSMLRLND